MNYTLLINSDDGMKVAEVDGQSVKYCSFGFVYKLNNMYKLVDKNTGLRIASALTLKDLEHEYKKIKQTYLLYCKSDTYNIKVERFKKLIDSYNYERNQQ